MTFKSFAIRPFVALLSLLCALSACNVDNDKDTELSDDCAIMNITLGTLRRTVTLKRAADGLDTTYTTNVAGNLYRMLVDQRNHRIYNADSLPMGTHIDRVTISRISADGVVAYRTLHGTDTIYSAGDSIDFTTPRYFTCFSYSGTCKQTYEVQLNVRHCDPNQFVWHQTDGGSAIAGLANQKLLIKDKTLYLFGRTAQGESVTLTSPTSDGSAWTAVTPGAQHPGSIDPQGVALFGGAFYTVADGTLWTSADAAEWQAVETDAPLAAVMLATSVELYAQGTDGSLYYSRDGRTWAKDGRDSDANLWPTQNRCGAWLVQTVNKKIQYAFLGGTDAAGRPALWKKVVAGFDASQNEPWAYYPQTEEVAHPFPALKQGVLLAYNNRLFHTGLAGDTLSAFYVSEDGGRSWTRNINYALPRRILAGSISAAVDDEQFLWIVCGGSGHVLRGRLNALASRNEQLIFEK